MSSLKCVTQRTGTAYVFNDWFHYIRNLASTKSISTTYISHPIIRNVLLLLAVIFPLKHVLKLNNHVKQQL